MIFLGVSTDFSNDFYDDETRVARMSWPLLLDEHVARCGPTCRGIYIHTYMCTYVRTYIHTYIHVYMCIYIYIYIFRKRVGFVLHLAGTIHCYDKPLAEPHIKHT